MKILKLKTLVMIFDIRPKKVFKIDKSGTVAVFLEK